MGVRRDRGERRRQLFQPLFFTLTFFSFFLCRYVLLDGYDNRPNLFGANHVTGLTFTGALRLRNAPAFHMYLSDVLNVLVENIDIWVDVTAQKEALAKRGLLAHPLEVAAAGWEPPSDPVVGSDDEAAAAGGIITRLLPSAVASEWASRRAALPASSLVNDAQATLTSGIPVFPLNTDGIDIAGRSVVVRNCTVENFDDSVCVKPLNGHSGPVAGGCSRDYDVHNVTVKLGVGLTIGSVPPNTATACVRNVTFRDTVSYAPIKFIYVKPNPGNNGDGIIDSVTYENVNATGALWWSIYVGTQQQQQPGNGSNTGCSFFFPLANTTCPPQPRVPVTNFTLRNVHSVDSLLSPGLLRCAPDAGWGACTGWLFDDVTMTSRTNWPVGDGYMCDNLVDPTFIGTQCTYSYGEEEGGVKRLPPLTALAAGRPLAVA